MMRAMAQARAAAAFSERLLRCLADGADFHAIFDYFLR
jgi:hypothetical protein